MDRRKQRFSSGSAVSSFAGHDATRDGKVGAIRTRLKVAGKSTASRGAMCVFGEERCCSQVVARAPQTLGDGSWRTALGRSGCLLRLTNFFGLLGFVTNRITSHLALTSPALPAPLWARHSDPYIFNIPSSHSCVL